jgi:hypothetical protein
MQGSVPGFERARSQRIHALAAAGSSRSLVQVF